MSHPPEEGRTDAYPWGSLDPADPAAADSAGWDSEPPRPVRPRRRVALVALAAVAVVLVGGGGAYAWARLSGGGRQPESALPSATVAVLKVDLDPSAGQKLAAYRLLRRVPQPTGGSGGGNADRAADARRDALGEILDEVSPELADDVDFDADIRPWLGARLALAAVGTGAGADLQPVLSVAYRDEELMRSSLERLKGSSPAAFGYRYRDGYVVLTKDQASADRVFADAGRGNLADSGRYRGDLDALEGEQVATAWVDIDAAWAQIPAADRAEARRSLGGQLGGRYAAGVHLTQDAVRVAGRGFDLRLPAAYERVGAAPSGALLGSLPADGLAAGAVSGLGEVVRQAWDGSGADTRREVVDTARRYGVTVPDDVTAALGSADALWVGAAGDSGGARIAADGPGTRAAVDKLLAATRRLAADEQAQSSADDDELGDDELGHDGLGDDGLGDDGLADDGLGDDGSATYGVSAGLEKSDLGDDVGGLSAFDPFDHLLGGFGGADDLVAQQPAGSDDVVLGATPAVGHLQSPGALLRDRKGFRDVVPDADGAGASLWVDVHALAQLAAGDEQDHDVAPYLEALDQFGLTATNSGDHPFQMTLTVR